MAGGPLGPLVLVVGLSFFWILATEPFLVGIASLLLVVDLEEAAGSFLFLEVSPPLVPGAGSSIGGSEPDAADPDESAGSSGDKAGGDDPGE